MRFLCSVLLAFIGILTLQAQEKKSSYQILESHLPIVSIRTNNKTIPDEPKIDAKMAIIQNDSSALNILHALFNDYSMPIGIEIRGESSQYFYPKKSFGIETRDSLGDNLNISVFGLPKENDWILYGPYGDKTMLRNALVYELAGKIMAWSPSLVLCELVIDNSYKGVYLFGEKIKRDKNRVDIAKLVEKDTLGNDLTGGYIIKIDKGERNSTDGWYSDFRPTPRSSQNIFYQYHYPKPEKIRIEQSAYIQNYMHAFEESLMGVDFKDQDKGYPSFIDVESFIDYFLLNELSRNVDGYRLSTFLYKDKDSTDGRLKIGPVWDYNLGFGNANYCNGFSHVGWAYKHNETCPNDYWSVPFWWERFMEDPTFKNKLKTRWLELREGPFHQDSLMEIINSKAQTLGSAVSRNYTTWPILGTWVWPNAEVKNSYAEELEEMKRWLSYRLIWLDNYIPGYPILTGTREIAMDVIAAGYPNPFDEYFTINGPIQPVDDLHLQVYSATGRLILEQEISSFPTQVFLNHQGAGFYYFSIRNRQGLIVNRGKMIKN